MEKITGAGYKERVDKHIGQRKNGIRNRERKKGVSIGQRMVYSTMEKKEEGGRANLEGYRKIQQSFGWTKGQGKN